MMGCLTKFEIRRSCFYFQETLPDRSSRWGHRGVLEPWAARDTRASGTFSAPSTFSSGYVSIIFHLVYIIDLLRSRYYASRIFIRNTVTYYFKSCSWFLNNNKDLNLFFFINNSFYKKGSNISNTITDNNNNNNNICFLILNSFKEFVFVIKIPITVVFTSCLF